MKLLFDQNLSLRLVTELHDLYPDSSHVSLHNLASSNDEVVWEFARTNHFVIVSKDSDFPDLSVRLGFPPKILWLRFGNCSTEAVVHTLRFYSADVLTFEADMTTGVLVIAKAK